MTISFEASRLKIQRAEKHVAELEQQLADYVNSGAVKIQVWREGQKLHHTIDLIRQIPLGLSAVLGDAIHNLRVSLDVLACDLVRMIEGPNANVDHWEFPFAKDEKLFEKKISDKWVKRFKARPEIIDHIRLLRPYDINGNQALYGTHQLDIQDKHKAILPTHGEIRAWKSRLRYYRKETWTLPIQLSRGRTHIDDGGEKLPPQKLLESTFTIVFPGGPPFGGREVIPTLHGLAKESSGVIDSFEVLCFGTISKLLPGT